MEKMLRGAKPAPPANRQCLLLVDWDDTLFPSTMLACCGYTLTSSHAVTPECQAMLDGLQVAVIRVLRWAIDHVGRERTWIITNSEHGWLWASAKKFMPHVVPWLQQLRVVSARTMWEGRVGPKYWKFCAVLRAMEQTFGSAVFVKLPGLGTLRRAGKKKLTAAAPTVGTPPAEQSKSQKQPTPPPEEGKTGKPTKKKQGSKTFAEWTASEYFIVGIGDSPMDHESVTCAARELAVWPKYVKTVEMLQRPMGDVLLRQLNALLPAMSKFFSRPETRHYRLNPRAK